MLHTQQVIDDLGDLINKTPVTVREMVAQTMTSHCDALATAFYEAMLNNPLAKGFLDHNQVRERLHASLARWLCELYQHPHRDLASLVARQRQVGEVHARVHLPVHFVARGARILKLRAYEALERSSADDRLTAVAMRFVGQLMDMALEAMSAAYEYNAERESRTDEAYRQHAIGQNLAAERERQRSNLLEWGQGVLLSIYRQAPDIHLPSISSSEFGLWLVHKGCSMFDDAPELNEIRMSMERLDATLLPQLQGLEKDSQRWLGLLAQLESEIEAVKFHLASLFDRQMEVENGRDTLTRLFNRRFLPSVISREIALARQRKSSFALLLVDIDHFKHVNDTHGHDAGDMVLQQTAMLLLNNVRSGDFVFRYGGEEMLVLLVEVSVHEAQQVAEKIRQRIQGSRLLIGGGQSISITISTGLAMFDGHPDYQFLIRRADEAMYQAKASGRNRICVA